MQDDPELISYHHPSPTNHIPLPTSNFSIPRVASSIKATTDSSQLRDFPHGGLFVTMQLKRTNNL
ncbi:unnamed protein product, partial [Vitis vinifera]|uniref:Uncharacterized protein n=1 Tax=Vitis vinifera TaxID=29760 RepID=E0CPW3_VITVI